MSYRKHIALFECRVLVKYYPEILFQDLSQEWPPELPDTIYNLYLTFIQIISECNHRYAEFVHYRCGQTGFITLDNAYSAYIYLAHLYPDRIP